MRRHRGGDYKTWHAEVLSKAREYNEFSVPMIDSEVKAISKSIAKWVWIKDQVMLKRNLSLGRLKRCYKCVAVTRSSLKS